MSIAGESHNKEDKIYIPTYKEVYSLNLREPSGLTVEQLELGLLRELKPYAWKYIEMEQKYGINAVFLASKDGWESGWGTYANDNNLSGWGYMPFDSPEKCIEHVSLYLNLWYLTEPHDNSECTSKCDEYRNENDECTIGQYYHGLTIGAVNTHYNGRAIWEKSVVGIIVDVYTRIEENELDIY